MHALLIAGILGFVSSSFLRRPQASLDVDVSSFAEDVTNNTVSVTVPGISSPLNVTDSATLGDWAYCTCKMDGANGTLVYLDRKWPIDVSIGNNVSVPAVQVAQVVDTTTAPASVEISANASDKAITPAVATAPVEEAVSAPSEASPASESIPGSLLQISVGTRRFGIERAEECECTNPWDNFRDPSESAVCSVNSGVNVCLVKMKGVQSPLTQEDARQQAEELLSKIDSDYIAANPSL